MEMKLQNSTPTEDYDGIDYWIDDIPFQRRDREISLTKYGDVSVRYYSHGGETEFAKILADKFLAIYWVFRFTDAEVIVSTKDIKNELQKGNYILRPNNDGTQGAYIKLASLPQKIVRWF